MTNHSKGNFFYSANIPVINTLMFFLFITIVLLVSSCSGKRNAPAKTINTQQDDTYKFRKDGELTFQNKNGEFISKIDLEFAETQEERARGLMYRTELNENQGMLFIFPREDMQSFWMKNTVLPLDMIFINSGLEIVTIRKNAKPYDESSYPSTKPAQYVVEVNAGYTDKFNINVGDKVVFRRTN